MRVLFLGGPWHNERHEVAPTRPSRMLSLPEQYAVPVGSDGSAGDAPRPRALIIYTRRYARGGGERRPVYVSPDYNGPARA